MKLFNYVLVAVFALTLICDASVSFAQETTKPKTAVKKKGKKKRPVFLEALGESVKDLSDDQKKEIEALRKAASESHKKINQSVGLTWKLSKKRQEIFDDLSEDLSFKERSEKASAQAGLTEEQVEALKDVGDVYRTFRFKSMNVLTEAQQAKMPKWFQKDFESSRERAEKEAAAKKKEASASKKQF